MRGRVAVAVTALIMIVMGLFELHGASDELNITQGHAGKTPVTISDRVLQLRRRSS